MMQYVQKMVVGITGVIVQIKIYNSTVTTGAGLTGLTYSTCGTLYYKRSDGTASVSVSINDITTFGTFAGSATAAAFKQVDSSNMPGVYELHLPNNAFAAGASEVMFLLKGGANAAPVELKIQLEPSSYSIVDLPVTRNVIYRDIAGQRLMIFAYNCITGQPLTGDAANISSYISIDGGSFTNKAYTWTELGNGYYYMAAPIAQADTDAEILVFKFTTSTANCSVQSVMVNVIDSVVTAKLTSDGLDDVSIASPSNTAILSDLTFRERLWFLAQRFIGKVTKQGTSPGTITMYNDNDVELKTQDVTDDGAGNQTISKLN